MEVKIKENINLKDLEEDNWHGCQYDTMLFLQYHYGDNISFKVKKITGMGNYMITIDDKDYIVNPKVFEILEDKKIKRIQSCGDNLYSEYIGSG